MTTLHYMLMMAVTRGTSDHPSLHADDGGDQRELVTILHYMLMMAVTRGTSDHPSLHADDGGDQRN